MPRGVNSDGPAEWVQRRVKTQLSADHCRCITVAAAITRGAAYNLAVNWDRAEFESWGGVTLTLRRPLSTFDFDDLTALVLAAHRHAVRVELAGAANHYLRLRLHPRSREGSISERHPSVAELVTRATELGDADA